MQHRFTVIGQPIAKQRPRWKKAGKTYTPEETVNYCNYVKMCFHTSVIKLNWKVIDFPIQVRITAYFQCPKSKIKKDGRFEAIKSTKPDVDNIAKAILDSLNGVAWVDDSLVYECTVSKYHTIDNPRCEVMIMW